MKEGESLTGNSLGGGVSWGCQGQQGGGRFAYPLSYGSDQQTSDTRRTNLSVAPVCLV